MIPVSPGELLDRISILQIKLSRLPPDRRGGVKSELENLQVIRANCVSSERALGVMFEDLVSVNAQIWDIEESKRECERRQDFGKRFTELARSVYILNDQRALLKGQVNEALGSLLREEKSYIVQQTLPYARLNVANSGLSS